MRQSHLILSNALVTWASRVLLLVPQVILVPFLIRTLGEAGYGVYALIWSLLMGIDRLEQSLQSGVIKHSAAFLAEHRIDEVNRVVSSSFVYSLLLAVVASVGIFIAAFLTKAASDLRISLFIVAVLILFIIPLTPYIAVIKARQCFFVGVMASTVGKYITLGVTIGWFSLSTPSVGALIVITAVMLLAERLIQAPIAHLMVPGLQNRPRLSDRNAFRLIFAFGGMTVFVALCNIANTTGIRWLMNWLVSTNFVAHLAIMLMPGMLLSQIVLAMTITVMPATSAYEATGNDRMLRELLIRSIRYTTVIVLAALLVAVLLAKGVVNLWVGPDYVFLAPYALAIFASVVFRMATSSAHHMLKGLGKLRITIIIQLIGNVILPFGLILLVFFLVRNPYLAVTVGLVAGNLLCAVLNTRYSVAAVHAHLPDVVSQAFVQPLFAGAVASAPAILLIEYADINTFSVRAGIAIIATLGFLAQMYLLYATPAERRGIRELYRHILSRRQKRVHA